MQHVFQPRPQPSLLSFQGIPIRVHRWLLIGMALISLNAGIQTDGFHLNPVIGTALALSILFVSVLLHELGHAFAARRLGVEVVDITLWPLGGIAVMRNMPEDPQVEMRIALAGPLVNLAIGGGSLLAWTAWHGALDWQALLQPNVQDLKGMLGFNAICHLMLGTFNLIPAFPMDGGKVLRSILALNRPWLAATEGAAKTGRILGWTMIFAAVYYGRWALLLVALYLLYAGSKELWSTRIRHLPGNSGPLADLLRRMSEGAQPDPNASQNEEESTSTIDGQMPTVSTSRGFSEDDILDMESQKGRLRPPQS